ncbi:hypothetical protein niasHT_011521 [Heterodera trifolii]|uniref:Uncharacterized protein n=1 Tax=Heterodera trifolii TaxID=157864 RepID=A0ABD2LFH7_9BILA
MSCRRDAKELPRERAERRLRAVEWLAREHMRRLQQQRQRRNKGQKEDDEDEHLSVQLERYANMLARLSGHKGERLQRRFPNLPAPRRRKVGNSPGENSESSTGPRMASVVVPVRKAGDSLLRDERRSDGPEVKKKRKEVERAKEERLKKLESEAEGLRAMLAEACFPHKPAEKSGEEEKSGKEEKSGEEEEEAGAPASPPRTIRHVVIDEDCLSIDSENGPEEKRQRAAGGGGVSPFFPLATRERRREPGGDPLSGAVWATSGSWCSIGTTARRWSWTKKRRMNGEAASLITPQRRRGAHRRTQNERNGADEPD